MAWGGMTNSTEITSNDDDVHSHYRQDLASIPSIPTFSIVITHKPHQRTVSQQTRHHHVCKGRKLHP
jgi:hypothetical protein